MEKLTFFEVIKKILGEKKIPLSFNEIWEIVDQKNYKEKCTDFKNDRKKELLLKLINDVDNNSGSVFKRLGYHRSKFIMKEDEHDNLPTRRELYENKSQSENIDCKDIEHKLSAYLNTYVNLYTKTISYKIDKVTNYTLWLHPFMAGVYFPEKESRGYAELKKEIGKSVILYSFEIIKNLGFHNLRESFFQALSTSIWANKSYMIAIDIEDENEPDFQAEFEKLSNKYGVGLIKLNVERPDASDIIYTATYNKDIDGRMIDKLTEESRNYNIFLESVEKWLNNGTVDVSEYNKI